MGLDQNLVKKTYVRNWNHMKPEARHQITVMKGGKPRADIIPARISTIVEDVAYWRKANAIHRWFVENIQNGVDDCEEYCVDKEQLAALVKLCKDALAVLETVPGTIHTGTTWYADGRVVNETRPGKVVAQTELADKLLPTQPGFFFGSTDYDEYYLQDLRDTIRQLEPLLDDKDGEFYYRASW